MQTFAVGEQLIWLHVNDETGERHNDLVTVMNVRTYPQNAYYTLRVDATGEAAFAWHDELRRYRPV